MYSFSRRSTGMFCKIFLVVLSLSVFVYPSYGYEAGIFDSDSDQFYYANMLYRQGYYEVAAREFGRVISDFPLSDLIDDAHYMMARSYMKAGNRKEAALQLSQFISNFPDSAFISDARSMLRPKENKEEDIIWAKELPVHRLLEEEKEPMRAVQVLLFKGNDLGEIEEELDILKSAGINTVIIRVFQNRGDRIYPSVSPKSKVGVYFKTSHSPVVADILGDIIKIAHERGIKVFAWMTTRYADYGMEKRSDAGCKGYDPLTGKVNGCKGLDLFNEEAVRYLEALYSDLADYDIDGVLFQDDLVLRHTEGFGPHAEAFCRRNTGRKLNPEAMYRLDGEGRIHYTPEFWEWAWLKNRRLLEVAGRLKAVVRAKRPGTDFAINLMYEAVSNPRYALAWLSQNLEESVREDFDYYAIMAYHRQMSDELSVGYDEVSSLIEQMALDATETVGDPQKVLMKIQISDWRDSTSIPDSEVTDMIHGVRKTERISLAVVPYRVNFPFHLLTGKTTPALR